MRILISLSAKTYSIPDSDKKKLGPILSKVKPFYKRNVDSIKPYKPLWKKGKKRGDMIRTANNKAYHGVSVDIAKKIMSSKSFRKGTHVTSSIEDAAYWAASSVDRTGKPAVIFQVDLKGMDIEHGDQYDVNHGVTTEKTKAVPYGIITSNSVTFDGDDLHIEPK